MDFLKEIVKEIGDEYTQIASDIDETERFIDTGSYVFNGLISGSIFGGVSSNRITAIAGESSTGKTYFSLAVVKNFLDTNPDGYCLYFDTEAAITKGLLASRGIDQERLVVVNVVSRCGYTPQYEGLQTLWTKYKKDLVTVSTPSGERSFEIMEVKYI